MDHKEIPNKTPQDQSFSDDAAMFKALGDERRLQIMHQIADKPGICTICPSRRYPTT